MATSLNTRHHIPTSIDRLWCGMLRDHGSHTETLMLFSFFTVDVGRIKGTGIPPFSRHPTRVPKGGRLSSRPTELHFNRRTCSVVEIPSSVASYVIVLITWWQANVVVNQMGRAILTEYGLAPITTGPSFTVAATPGAVGSSRWLAPELITPRRRRTAMPVMESKAADVFAFGMLGVEVFTGEVPFEGMRTQAVVLHIVQGGRPERPVNTGDVGLTDEIWDSLERCWRQNPKKRPTIKKVVRKWQEFVEDGIVIKCV